MRAAIIDKKTGIVVSVADVASDDNTNYGTQGGMNLALVTSPDAQVGDTWTVQQGFTLAKTPPTETNLRIAMAKFGLASDAIDEVFKLASSM